MMFILFYFICVQIYELLAGSTSERSKWIKHITEASNPHKSKDGMSKTKVEQILTSYWSIKQPIICKISSCANPHKSKDGMSKTKVEQIPTSYWSIRQPIACIFSSCANPHKSKDGMSKTKVEQILTSYWSIKQPIMSMDLFTCQPAQVQGGHVQDQGTVEQIVTSYSKQKNCQSYAYFAHLLTHTSPRRACLRQR